MKKLLQFVFAIIISFLCIYFATYNNYDKKELRNVISYKVSDSNKYTPNSYNEYKEALNRAIDVNKSLFVSKDDVNNAINDLKDKYDNLDIKPDKSILINKYNKALDIDLNLYTPNSLSYLRYAINRAKMVIDDNNSVEEDVNDSINKLDSGINSLIYKPDKTNLTNVINKANNINKNDYTTASYSALKKSIDDGYMILYDVNATKKDVDNIIKLIDDSIDSLAVVSIGEYKITYSIDMISNNHVGNEWGYEVSYNNSIISSGYIISGEADSSITISSSICEYDSVMDYGTSSVDLSLTPNFSITDKIIVTENRGRYYGNEAIFEINYYVELIGTK